MYVSLVELADRPGALELAQAATPERFRTVDAALLDALLRDQDVSNWPAEEVEIAELTKQAIVAEVEAAGGLIDGFLARRGYALPLTRTYSVVTGWARAIARYKLHQARLSTEKDDPIVRDYRDALALLKLVAEGKFSLGTEDPLTPPSSGAPKFSAPARVFTAGTLRDF